MESATKQVETIFIISSIISKVEERFERVYVSGVGPDALFKEISLGWYISIYGSREALYIGESKPELEIGNKIKISIRKTS